MPGIPELLLILVIVLVIFGPGKLPALGEALGRTIRNFRKSSKTTDEEIDVTPKKGELQQKAAGQISDAQIVDDGAKKESVDKVAPPKQA
jgi:sec-independent protein translocase protein TatA